MQDQLLYQMLEKGAHKNFAKFTWIFSREIAKFF